MKLSNEDLAKEAGVNPWELRDDLTDGNPAEIITLAQQFHTAAGHAADATGIAAKADEITAAGYRIDDTPVHDVNTHLQQTRTHLGNSGENMELIARDLATIADELADRTTTAKVTVVTLDHELERVRAAADRLVQDAYANPIAIDPATGWLRNYNQEAVVLKEAAVGMVRNSGATVRDLVDGYEDILTSRLKSLAEMGYDPPAELDAGSTDPDIPSKGTDPKQVNGWWKGLTPYQQRELIAEHPEQIGNLDGIPTEVRHEANRSVLASEATRLDERIAELKHEEPENLAAIFEIRALEEQRKDLAVIEQRLDAPVGEGKQHAYLLGFDPDGNGRAIVAMGDPDTADNIVTFVPGTGAGLSSAGDYMAKADLMATEANALDPSSPTSSIMWIGYDAPQDIVKWPPGSGDAISSDFAERGAPALDSFQDGLRATHQGPRSHNTVLGHSYGSTVVGYTAKDHGLDADDVIFVGSPGVGVEKAAELGIGKDHVWSSHAKNDPIQFGVNPGDLLAHKQQVDLIHGHNPSDPDFGGRTFTSDPGKPLITWKERSWGPMPLPPTPEFHGDAHSQYWDPRSASLKNMTAIITGHNDLVK
ncbi:MAG: alpha/beta hydrolase [Pseudonocardiaceae bacterium]